MDDQKRLELMQQMLGRLTGQPVSPAPIAPPQMADPEVEQASAFDLNAESGATDSLSGPTEARLRVLKDLLGRLGD